MTAAAYPATLHTASPRSMDVVVGFFCVFGGPAAWFVALCGGFALATRPCVIDGMPKLKPAANLQWTGTAIALLMGIAVLIALSSVLVAWRASRRVNLEVQRHERHSMDAGVGRARFLALWGMLLGSVFALATAMTALGVLMLPRCGG